MTYLLLMRKNLFRHKLRTSLMIVCILTAFAIFGVLASIEHAVNAGQDVAAADRLVVVNKINFTQPLPIAYFDRVRAIEGVQQVTHVNWFGGYYQDPKNSLVVMAVDPTTYMQVMTATNSTFRRTHGSPSSASVQARLSATPWLRSGDGRSAITCRSRAASSRKRTARTAGTSTSSGSSKAREPEVDTNYMVFQYNYFDATRAFGQGQIGWMVLRTASPALNDQIARTIDQTFANSAYETSTDTEKALNKAFVAQFGNIRLIMVLVMSGAAFVTILMIVGNTLMMSVRERTREIGVLKSLGFPPSRILRLILGEAILLAMIGGVQGLAWAALFIISVRDSVRGILPQISLSPDVALTGLALMLGFGIVTGLIPALNAMRLRVGAALGRS